MYLELEINKPLNYFKLSGRIQNCMNISRWLKNLSDSFKTVWKLTDDLKFSTGKFPDNFKLFFHCFGDAQIFDFYLIMHFAALSWGAITRFFGFLRETLTHASSGKFLHVESCYLESFVFLPLVSTYAICSEYNLTRGTASSLLFAQKWNISATDKQK